ncbi:hypothetical protein [Novosphingobium album (ex Hu et al. 2023)]|uniref:Uncharacterized protein n=1 Tax=Novosphingobium album (ex Hu et al. 2023) TaxID=2930093 RepID=A0ABT0B7I8_9SPHN|nr:hypothetical protein [Novosphingobium album (ex Hu et al. 2023)]MCJ2181032.1 hypothetical protein [Novosphingobium album (ex Hu et al. 2023)]
MDLNQLLFHHQLALIQLDTPDVQTGKRQRQFDLVRHYEKRITRLREEMGVSRYPGWI